MKYKREVVKAVAYHLITLPCLDTSPTFEKHVEWHYSKEVRKQCKKFFELLKKIEGTERRMFLRYFTGVLDE